MKNNKRLIASLSLNILLLVVLAATLNHYGVFGRALAKFTEEGISGEVDYETPYYKLRKDVFDNNTSEVSENSVVLLGDSLVNINEWNVAFPDTNVINRGINSDTTIGVLNRLDNIIKIKPKKIFIMIGTNDVIRGLDANILNNYSEIISSIKNGSPDTTIYINSILPVNYELSKTENDLNEVIRVTNEKLKAIASDTDVEFIDIHSLLVNDHGELEARYTLDGVHLNGKGYKIWEELLSDYLQ